MAPAGNVRAYGRLSWGFRLESNKQNRGEFHVELPINVLMLHRDPGRHQYFSRTESREPFFDTVAKAWIITDSAQCRELIGSSKLHPATYAEDYKVLEQRLGLDFSSLSFAFAHIPICLHGDRHARARRRVSEFLASRKAALNARIPDAVATHFNAFRREGRVEIMKDAILPLVLDIISTVIDIDISDVDCQNASLVFDKSISVNKRRNVAAEIATLRDLISGHLGPNASEDDIGMRLALLVLGKDALIGTLGESLHRLLEANPGRRLTDIEYPDFPPETGVPFIERVVVNPFMLAAKNFALGDRVRIFLQTFAYEGEPRSRTNFFGAGPHACLGRPVSLEIWNAITALLSAVPLYATVLSYAARTSDYVFACPEHLQVELRQ
jgi:cytochrome P450